MNIAGAYLGWCFFLSEAGLAIWRRARSSGDHKLDANSLRLLWIVNTASIGLGVWLALSGIGPRLPEEIAWGWIGVAVFAIGTTLRWWAIYYLGRFFTVDVAVAADHQIIDTGPYRLIRHPSYTGLILQFLGLGLTFGTVLSLAVVAIPPVLSLLYRVRVEEAALLAGLGAGYAEYVQRTKRLIPFVF